MQNCTWQWQATMTAQDFAYRSFIRWLSGIEGYVHRLLWALMMTNLLAWASKCVGGGVELNRGVFWQKI